VVKVIFFLPNIRLLKQGIFSYRFMDLFPDATLVRDMQNELDLIIQQGVFQLTRLLKNSEQGGDEDEFTMSRYKQAKSIYFTF